MTTGEEFKSELWQAVMRYVEGHGGLEKISKDRQEDVRAISELIQLIDDPVALKQAVLIRVREMCVPWYARHLPCLNFSGLRRTVLSVLRRPAYSDMTLMSHLLSELQAGVQRQQRIIDSSEDSNAIVRLQGELAALSRRYEEVVRQNDRLEQLLEEQDAQRSFHDLSLVKSPDAEVAKRLDRLEEQLAQQSSGNKALRTQNDALLRENALLLKEKAFAEGNLEMVQTRIQELEAQCRAYAEQIKRIEGQLSPVEYEEGEELPRTSRGPRH